MPERLVDVSNTVGTILHTFPVVAQNSNSTSEEAYQETALKLAAHARLVPSDDVETLAAKMHVARGGPLAPFTR